ncbi:hypothetical protein DFY03_23275 [Escherichia coli]|nr:hypothetical protein [Escherichia coli]EFO2135389.1 hypothetical protein [Escherichia coli]
MIPAKKWAEMPESFVVNAVLPGYATLLILQVRLSPVILAATSGVFFTIIYLHHILPMEQLENQFLSS